MTQWQSVPLGEAIELAYGKSLPKGSRVESGSIPVYGSNGITGWHDTAVVDGPAVIVGRKGSAGAVQFVDGPCFPIDTTYFARPRQGFDFDIKFLFYTLRQLDLSRLKTATGVPGLTREDAYRETIRVTPLPEQRRIVDLLSRAEGIVRLRREAEKKAAELIPALFLDMFGDPATNLKGWKSGKFADVVADIRNGFNPTKEQFGTGTRFITVNGLYNGLTIDTASADRVSAEAAVIAKYRLRRGDLCFVRSSVKRSGVGMASVFDSDDEAVFGGFVIRAQLTDRLLPVFACAMFHIPSVRKIVVESAGTGTITNINQPALLSVPIIEPPLELQQDFALKVQQAASIQTQQSTATAKAQATFDALLAQAFS